MILPDRRAAACVLALLLAAAPISALAHSKLVRAEPARRATLARPPAQVRLCFNETPEAAFSQVRVTDAKGAPVGDATAQPGPDDPRCLVLALPTLAPGVYTVHYHVLSVDGHTVKASHPFTIQPAPPGR